VTRARDTRMARLEAPAAHADSAEMLDRCALRALVTVRALVGDALTQAGIDPVRAQALRLGEEAELPPAAAAPHPDPLPASRRGSNLRSSLYPTMTAWRVCSPRRSARWRGDIRTGASPM
jgi:hypothetical protein